MCMCLAWGGVSREGGEDWVWGRVGRVCVLIVVV